MVRLAAAWLVALPGCAAAAVGWEGVQHILEAYFPLKSMSFSAGDATGRKFTFEKGTTNMSTELAMASASKFPAALAIAGAVADGHLSFDTRVHEVFPWWTAEPADRRSRVTLRHLLSFTSGFWSPDVSGSLPCVSGNSSSYTSESCAREIYEQAPFEFEPGTTWAYNSFHLQVAGAMAAAAAKSSVQEVLQKYLVDRLNLTGTFWMGDSNPVLAASMITTGDDYDKILRSYLAYELVPKPLAEQMEQDYLAPPVQAANSSLSLTLMLGHYSMCSYFECLPPKKAAFTDACKQAGIHVDAGLYGYYPIIDRGHGTYMQLVTMSFPKSQREFFGPTVLSLALRVLVKASVDQALRGGAVSDARPQPLSRQAVWDATAEVLSSSPLGAGTSPAELWRALGVEAEEAGGVVVV